MPFFGVPIRNGLPIGLGSVAGFGVQQFDPSQLFEGGTVAGAWYDPSDLSTMFDSSAGTTPVAMPGQGAAVPVGLMLDKSQGLVLGSELVTNGDFSNGLTGWTAPANWVASSGGATITSSSTFEPLEQTILVPGKNYKITFDVVSISSGTLTVVSRNPAITSTVISNITTAGAKSFIYTVPSGETVLTFARLSGTTLTCTIDNVSVRELPGNHAISFNNTTARPELRARVNLLTYSEDFSNAAWLTFGGASKISANAIRLTSADIASNVYQQFTAAETNASSYVFSVEVKRNAATNQTFQLFQNIRGVIPFGRSGDLVATDEWQRFTLTHTSAGGSIGSVFGIIGNTAGTQADLLVRNADLRPANIGANVPAYQRIADALTYDTSGFPLYLYFDGTDDGMSFNALALSDQAIWFGMMPQNGVTAATASQPLITTSSGDFSSVGFGSVTSTLTDERISWLRASGALVYGAGQVSNDFDVAPYVLTFQYTTTPATSYRRNAVTQTLTTTSGGGAGGAFTAAIFPTNYGRIAANATLTSYFRGNIYSLIIAGSAVSAGNISATEQWVAQKTGIQI